MFVTLTRALLTHRAIPTVVDADGLRALPVAGERERWPLVLGFRETPLSIVHLENLRLLAYAGAVILPPTELGEYLIEELARIPVEVEYASELRYRNPIIPPNTLVGGISQSGETADTLAALREAQNYVRAYTRGLGIFELPEYLAWPDWEEWEPLTAWLRSKRSQP